MAATDFKGKGTPCEKGRTSSWKVPSEALPVQPAGTAADTDTDANRRANRVRITPYWMRRLQEKSIWGQPPAATTGLWVGELGEVSCKEQEARFDAQFARLWNIA
jgi:hypothetical protein